MTYAPRVDTKVIQYYQRGGVIAILPELIASSQIEVREPSLKDH
jgi:hypothetical protein